MPAAQLGALVGVCAHLVQCGFINSEDPQWLVSHDGDTAWSSMQTISELKSLVQRQLCHAIDGISLRLSSSSDIRSNDILRLTRADEQKLWRGDLEEAFDALLALRRVVSAPQMRADLALNMARAKQFAGSAARQQGKEASHLFEAAHALLDEAEATARTPSAKNAIRLQQLQVRRAAADEQVDPKLLADFVAFQKILKLSDQMPTVVAFIDFLRGDLASAERGYQRALDQDKRADNTPNGLLLCRMGQVQLAAGKYGEAADNLQCGLASLLAFPEKKKFVTDLQQAQKLSRQPAHECVP